MEMSKVYIMILQAMTAYLDGRNKFFFDSSLTQDNIQQFKECLLESGLKVVPLEQSGHFTIEDL
jgi:hypothetical protein